MAIQANRITRRYQTNPLIARMLRAGPKKGMWAYRYEGRWTPERWRQKKGRALRYNMFIRGYRTYNYGHGFIVKRLLRGCGVFAPGRRP